MKFTIKRQVLEKYISNLNSFTEKKDQSAVNSHIYFKIDEQGLVLKATDNEIGLKYLVTDVELKESGEATAHGKNLLDIIKNLKDGEITLSSENDNLHVKQNRSQFKIAMQRASDFPFFPKLENKDKFDINAGILSQSLKKVEYCIDPNNPKYEFTGALLDIKENGMNIVASDGRRLAVYELNISAGKNIKIIIPKRAITEIQKLLTQNIEIFYDETILMARAENFVFFTKLINGTYADYERLINSNFANKITLNRNEIIDGIKTVKLLSEDIKISFSKEIINFSTQNQLGEIAQTETETNLEIAGNYDIKVKSKNILDFLGAIESDSFEFNYNDAGMPIMLKSENLRIMIVQVSK